jgi:hypothetical protein
MLFSCVVWSKYRLTNSNGLIVGWVNNDLSFWFVWLTYHLLLIMNMILKAYRIIVIPNSTPACVAALTNQQITFRYHHVLNRIIRTVRVQIRAEHRVRGKK